MSILTDKQARDILVDAWRQVWNREPTEKEVLYTLAVARLETGYGRIGQHGKLAEQGMYNWANVEKAPTGNVVPSGWAEGVDSGRKVWFRVYPSDLEAAKGLVQNLTKRHWPTIEAMKGSAKDVAHAMKVSPAYYEAPEEKYAAAIESGAHHIQSKLGTVEPALPASLPVAQKPKSKTILPIAAAVGFVGFAYWKWWRA